MFRRLTAENLTQVPESSAVKTVRERLAMALPAQI
jgi:hypothetical protein